MKRIIPALAMCGALLANSLPVTAAYEPQDITLCLRALDLPENADPQLVRISPEDAKTGTKLHLGLFIEADRAELSLMGIKLHSDSKNITFPAEVTTPKTEISETPVKYTLPDGTEFETKFKPYCLGTVNTLGNYTPNCFSCTVNTDAEDNSLTVMWMYGIGQADTFLGGKSDAYSFLEFDVTVAENIPAGVYHIDFVTAEDAQTAIQDHLTYVTSDNGTQAVSEYHDIIPGAESLTIIVDDTSPATETTTDPTEATTETTTAVVSDPTETTEEDLTDPPMPTTSVTDPTETTETSEDITDPPMPTTAPSETTAPTETTEEDLTDPPMPTTEHTDTSSDLKGDASGNGEVNAEDASLILMYAAAKGAGESAKLGDDANESQRVKNADVNADGELDATDASAVLVYAAAQGAGSPVTWKEIFG